MTTPTSPPTERPLGTRLDEQFSKIKHSEETIHQLLQCCAMFGHLMEELNFVKATLDMSLSYFYKDRGAIASEQVREFIKLQPQPSSVDFAISNFQKYVTESSYQYARIFNHFKVLYETVKPDSSESANLLDDMETFYEQRHHPFDSITSTYLDISSTMVANHPDRVKQLATDVRESIQTGPAAPYDPKPEPAGKQDSPTFQEVIASPLCREYLHQFLQSQISGENYLFWDAVRKFKEKANNLSKNDLRRQVERIVARYLSIGGENEINISAAVRDPIMDNIEAPTPDIFEGAVKEVYSMMHGSFPLFEQSPEYRLMQHRRRKTYVIPVAPQRSDTDIFSSDVKNFQKTIKTVHQMVSKIAPPRKSSLSKSREVAQFVPGNIPKPAPPANAAAAPILSMIPKGMTHSNLGAQVNCLTLIDNYLWVGLNDSISIFNPLAMAQLKQLKHPGKVHSIIQVSPTEVWSSSDGGGPIKCWDSEKFKNSKDVMAASFVKGEVVTYMAKIRSDMIWVGTMSGMIRIWTIPKKKMVHEMKVGPNPIWYMIAQESSSSVWVAHGEDITRFHSVSYRKAETFPKEHTAHVTSMVLTEQFYNKNNFSSITTVLWTGGLDGCICLWDTETPKCLQKFHEHTDAVLHLSQSKLFVFSSSFDRSIISWDKHNPSKIKQFSDGHTGPVTCSLALGRVSGGSALWTGSQDSTIRAWPLE